MPNDTIYISYSRRDRYYALQLEYELNRAGISARLDTSILKAGQPVEETLLRAIDHSAAVVVLVSENSTGSSFIPREIEYARAHGKQIIPILLGNNYEFLRAFELDNIYALPMETSADVQKIVDDLADYAQPGLDLILDHLRELQFDPNFVQMFRRLAHGIQDEALILHYHDTLELGDAEKIENSMNQLAWDLLAEASQLDILAPLMERREGVFTVSSYTHPGSTELLLELSQAALVILNDPVVRDVAIGLVSSVIFEIGKATAERLSKRFFGARKENEWYEIADAEVVHMSVHQVNQISRNVETISSDGRYFGFAGGRIVWGTERKTVETKRLKY